MSECERLEMQAEDIIRKKARKIVNEILNDLTDRKGLGNEWEAIDEDIQAEIIDTWVAIVKARI